MTGSILQLWLPYWRFIRQQSEVNKLTIIQSKLIIIKNKSSTMEILSQIQNDFKKQKSLESYLPGLVQSLNSQKKVFFTNMNAKQKLTQLQQLIQSEYSKIQSSLSQQNIDLQGEDEEQLDEQLIEQLQGQEAEEQAELDEQDEENLDDQGEAIDEEQLQGEQADEQFPEPQFDENAQKYNRMMDENYGEARGQQNEKNQQDEEDYDGEDDVGLYGEQLNEEDEDMEKYDNEFDQEEFKEFEKQFGNAQDKAAKKNKGKPTKMDEDDGENPDDHVEDNFDHFRQIEIQNLKVQEKQVPKTELDNQIDRLEGKVFGKKDWVMKGQIKAKERPSNSLLEYDLQFNSGIKYSHEITEERNTQLQELIKKRILSDMFDDRTRFINTSHIREHFGSMKQVSRQKSQMGLGEVYESQFKNFLGIGENKNDKVKTQIMDSFKQLNYFLDSLSNFSFVPKPIKDSTKKGQSEAIVVEEKVPLTLWNGQKQIQKDGKHQFESQKQVDNQAKRLKNKRIARQRKKEQDKKKLNKKIEYGGITKFEAQAKKKAQMNNKPLKVDGVNMKYNKSASFFKNINQNKGGKPNPDISKMKI